MYKYTLTDAQNESCLLRAANVAPTSTDFADYVNQATRLLMRRGEWFDLDWVISLCVSGCIISWPWWVSAIHGVKVGKGRPAQLFNNYWQFVGPHHRHSGWHGDATVVDVAMGPCSNDISGTTGKNVRYYVVQPTDLGKTITIFGSQYGAQPLQELGGTNYVNGVTLTAANPYAQTSQLVTTIDAITRQATDGMAYLYEYDPVAQTLRDLAVFEPNETNPRRRRSRILNAPWWNCNQPDANGITWTNVEALVKLEFIPVKNARDFLMLDNFDALALAIKAVKAMEANDSQAQEIALTQAIRELNFDLRSKHPDDQTPIRVNSIMGRHIINPV